MKKPQKCFEAQPKYPKVTLSDANNQNEEIPLKGPSFQGDLLFF